MRPGCIRADDLIYHGARVERVPSQKIRAFYREHVGPIPEGEHVHHLCGNPWCIAPEHLATLTKYEHLLTHRYRGIVFGFDETAFAAG
jgi:hypothetical protein